MSPFLKNGGWRSAVVSLCALAAFHCGGDSSSSGPKNVSAQVASVTMQMNYASTPLIDSLVVECVGADTLHLAIDPETPYVDLDLFPHDNWKFTATLYANGNLMQRGEATAKLEAGSTADITIQMHAVVGFVHVEIPLGLGNPAGIAGGTMSIEGGGQVYTYPMQIAGTTAVFTSGMLPLDIDYTISITMTDASGTAIYEASEAFHLSESTPVPELQIKSLRAKVSLSIGIAENIDLTMNAGLPGGKFAPKPGDLIVSEFMTSPLRSDSSQFEFIEIYNGTLDTMLLDGCTLGTTSQESKGWPITLPFIAPGKAAVFGDTSASTPDAYRNTALWGDLTNTKGAIVLACGGTVIDSLFYSATQDSVLNNLIPNSSTTSKNPLSSHLKLDRWAEREDPESWCLGAPDPGNTDSCE